MSETAQTAPGDTGGASPEKKKKEDSSFLLYLLKLALAVLIFRSFLFSPFSIPSESMLPRLWNGDQLIASKWSYGISSYSLPFSLPLIPGRWFASQPERGDVAIFKQPVDHSDYIKRVIGLPGDQVQMRDGQLFLNGEAVPKIQVDDFVIPVSPNTDCKFDEYRTTDSAGNAVCHYPQYRETLPNGVSYNVLDLGLSSADNTQVFTVPEGQLFMMGDNRDNSQDSRFPPTAGGGIGFVPQENLVGKAQVMMWSSDGSLSFNPMTWFGTVRWDRIGGGI